MVNDVLARDRLYIKSRRTNRRLRWIRLQKQKFTATLMKSSVIKPQFISATGFHPAVFAMILLCSMKVNLHKEEVTNSYRQIQAENTMRFGTHRRNIIKPQNMICDLNLSQATPGSKATENSRHTANSIHHPVC